MSSAICFNLDQCKILLSCKGLIHFSDAFSPFLTEHTWIATHDKEDSDICMKCHLCPICSVSKSEMTLSIFVHFVEDNATLSSIRYFKNHISYFVQNRRK